MPSEMTDAGYRGQSPTQAPAMPAAELRHQITPQDIIGYLRQAFPHGHPSFLPFTLKELELHSLKNHDYSKGGSPLGNFDRVAAILSLYPQLRLGDRRVVALIYALKQLDAVLWGLNSNIEHKVEGLNDRLGDISVYAKLVMCMNSDAPSAGEPARGAL